MINFNNDGNIEVFYEMGDVIKYRIESPIVTTKKKVKYYNAVNTFDIESTTLQNTDPPIGFMYAFMLYFNGYPIIGRRWEEFINFINHVKNSNEHIVVFYVHYLTYEFQFIRNFFKWDEVFAIEKRKVLRARTGDVEFRCSYYLSNMSLDMFLKNGKRVIHYKKTGHFDYTKIRTCSTKLTDIELSYCFNDVVGLYERLLDYMENDTIASIPYTSTGFVRRNCRKAMRKNEDNRKWFINSRLNIETYNLLCEAMRGGNTAGNRRLIGYTLHNVRNFDAASSYPYQMMVKYFPVGVFMKVSPDKEEMKRYLNEYCCLFRVYLKNVKLKKDVPIPYISQHKCFARKNVLQFNGRIIEGDYIATTVTELDFKIINEQYDFDSEIGVSDFHIAKRGELPIELKNEIMIYFNNKTKLKYTDKYLYAKSKELLNSIFGMACTNPVREMIVYENGWIDGDKITNEVIEIQLEKFYKNRNSFLPYQIGIWVTAHARYHLQEIINITGMNTAYTDTDSDKVVGLDNNQLNEINRLNNRIKEECEKYGAYCDHDGKRYYMGFFEEEDPYIEFKTKGAKKYAYIKDDRSFHITLSGVSKEEGAKEIIEKAKEKNPLDLFEDGFIFEKSGRTTHYYNDTETEYLTINGDTFMTGSNIGIVESTYTLSSDKDFKSFLENYLDEY